MLRPNSYIKVVHRVFQTGSLVTIDQGLFSGTGFLSTLMLARWMSPGAFGLFTTIQSVAQLTIAVHASLLLDPMSVLANSVFKSEQAAYTRIQLKGHYWLSISLGLLIVPILWVTLSTSQRNFWPIAVTAVLCHPLYLSIWFVRRYCYNTGRIATAASVSAAYLITAPATLFLLDYAGDLTGVTAWIASAGCAAIASLLAVVSISRLAEAKDETLPVSLVIREHWAFGSWSLIGTFAYTIALQLPIFAMTRWIGPESAGAFRAINLLNLPLSLLIPPANSAVLPAIAAAQSRGDQNRAFTIAMTFGGALLSISIVYMVISYWLAGPLVHFLYGTKYDAVSWLVPILGLVNVALGSAAGCTLLLGAARQMRSVAASTIPMLIVAVMGTVILVPRMGLVGTVFTIVSSAISSATSILAIYVRRRRA